MFKRIELTEEIYEKWHRVPLTNFCDWNDMCDFIDVHFVGRIAAEVLVDWPFAALYIENDQDAMRFKLSCIK
jgi:hypothetical protein